MTAGTTLDPRPGASYLNCPRCGLSIEVRAPWLTIQHCPRCVARTRTVVDMFSSGLPVDALYAAESRPDIETTVSPRGGTQQTDGVALKTDRRGAP